MANSVVVKLQLEDELTPELKRAQKELEALASEVLKTDRTLKELKSDKKGIMKGAIESDIKGIKELQNELKKFHIHYETAPTQTTRTTAKNNIAQTELKIEKLINAEIAKKTELLRKQKDAEQITSKKTQKALDEEIRKRRQSTKAIKSETVAIKANSTSRLKENAERRALTTTLIRQIRRLESMAVAYFALTSAYKSTIGAGIELNRQYQSMEIGLAAILASKTKAIDMYGKEVSAVEKFQKAQEVTKQTLDKIKKASLDTPATFEQMVGFYQQAIGHALKAGEAFGDGIQEISDRTIQLTKRMSNLGSSVGMPMDRINEEIRSLMSGNASTDSLLSSILFGSPSAANKAIREAKTRVGGLWGVLDENLRTFEVLEGILTYDKAMAHLKASLDTLKKSATKNIFKDVEYGAEKLSQIIAKNSDRWAKQIDEVYQTVKKLTPVITTLIEAFITYKALGAAKYTYDIIKSTVMMNAVYSITTRKIRAATTAQVLFNKALKNNPIGWAATAVVGLYEVYDNLPKHMSLAQKAMKDFREETEAATLASVNFQIQEKKRLLADLAKEQNKEARNSYGGVITPHGRVLANQALEASKQLDILLERKKAILKENGDIKLAQDKITLAIKKTKEETKGQTKLWKDWAKEKQKLLNSIETQGLGTYEKQYKEAEQWYKTELEKYKNIKDAELIIAQVYSNKIVDIATAQENEISTKMEESRQKALEKMQKASTMFNSSNPEEQKKEEINNKYWKIADTYGSLFNDTQMKNFFKSWNNDLEKVHKGYQGLGSRDWAAGLKGQAKDIANVSNALRDIGTEQKKWEKFQKESIVLDKDKQAHLEAQMGAYSMLAGTIASAAQEGSAAAVASTIAQATLGIASSYSAIAQAWSQPFPLNLGAAAMVTAQVMPIINQLKSFGGGSSGGGSGGGSSFSASSAASDYKKNIDDANKPILDRLDKQIDLLEKIGQAGTSTLRSLERASINYNADMSKAATDVADAMFYNPVSKRVDPELDLTVDPVYNRTDITKIMSYDFFGNELIYSRKYPDLFKEFDKKNKTNLQGTINNNTPVIRYNRFIDELGKNVGAVLDMAVKNYKDRLDVSKNNPSDSYNLAKLDKAKEAIIKLQPIIYDFASSVSDSISHLKDASNDFKDIFDSITNTTTYATKDLEKAYIDIKNIGINNQQSMLDYIQKQINTIDDLNSKFNRNIKDLLLSDDIEDIVNQAEAVNELSKATGIVFENGASDALNYLDSIKAVGDAMAQSNNNVRSFVDNFKTDEVRLKDLTSGIQAQVANSYVDLFNLYDKLKGGVGGLTNSELELLNANKALLDSYQKLNIGIEESIVSIADNLINSLQSNVNSRVALQLFQSNMSLAMRSTDRKAVEDALKEATKYQSALFNSKNFSNKNDMDFAQLVALNQATSVKTDAQKQIEYLKDIHTEITNLRDITEKQAQIIQQLEKESQIQTDTLINIENGKVVA